MSKITQNLGNTQGKNSCADDHSANIKSRRRAIGAMAGVSLAVWHKPVIDAVVLPAHAQMSTTMPEALAFFGGALVASKSNTLLEALVPVALAGENIGFDTASAQALLTETSPESGEFDMQLLIDFTDLPGAVSSAQGLYSGKVSTAAAANLSLDEDPCSIAGFESGDGVEQIAVEVDSVAEDEAVLLIDGAMLKVPSGTGMLPSPSCSPNTASVYTILSENGVAQANQIDTQPRSILDSLVAPAAAQDLREGPSVRAEVSGTDVSLEIVLNDRGIFSAELGLFDSNPTALTIDEDDSCPQIEIETISAAITFVSAEFLTVSFEGDVFGDGFNINVPAVDLMLPPLRCSIILQPN